MQARFSSVTSSDTLITTGLAAFKLSSTEIRAEHATASAVRHLSEREAAFSKSDLLASALNFQVRDLDHGPIVAQAVVPVLADDSEDTLAARVLAREHVLYPLAVRWFAEGALQVDGHGVVRQARG